MEPDRAAETFMEGKYLAELILGFGKALRSCFCSIAYDVLLLLCENQLKLLLYKSLPSRTNKVDHVGLAVSVETEFLVD